MAYWIKISYDRKEYVIDLERVSAFAYEPNSRITFWLPDSAFPIVISPQAHPDAHQTLITFIEKVTGIAFEAYWVKIDYERNEYLINLKGISAFSYEQNGRITFWLPDGAIPIVINPQTNREAHEKVMNYIRQATGVSLP